MKVLNIKKLNIVILAMIIGFANIATFAEANIIYAPTREQTVAANAPTKEVYSPSAQSSIVTSESISAASYPQDSIDYVNTHNLTEKNNNLYCYENGEPVRNGWRKINRLSFALYAPVDNFSYSYIWAYFGSNGAALKGSSGSIKKARIGNYTYSFNEHGQLLTGFFNESGEMWNELMGEDPFDLLYDGGTLYHSSDLSGAMTSGWYKLNSTTSRYPNKTSIWMYFSPSNFKITRATGDNYKSLNVDGKTYAFDDNGVMLTGFEATQYNEEHGGSSKVVYFGEDGAEVKNGFYYVDLSDDTNAERFEDYEDYDEDITIYLSKNGMVYKNTIKKIGSSYYGFDYNGVVLKGLTVWNGGDYVTTIDVENTDAKDFIMSGNYSSKYSGSGSLSSGDILHYFDSRGKRVTTSARLDFSDAAYTYSATNGGALEGSHNGKYYIHGLMLKPVSGVKYGVYIVSPNKTDYSMSELVKTTNVVITNSGSVISSKSAQKDEDDNYWLISSKSLINIYTVPIKVSGSTYYFKSENSNGREDWIKFGEKDAYGKTCVTEVLSNGTRVSGGAISAYQTTLNSESAMNFNIH